MELITAKKAKQIQRLARIQQQEQFIKAHSGDDNNIIEHINTFITNAAKANKNTETMKGSSITDDEFKVLQTIFEDYGYTVELNLDERKITVTW